MRRWLGILLVLVLSVSVVLPARLHAMGQTQAAQGHTAHDNHAMHHEDAAAGFQQQLPQSPQEHRQHAVCLAACACLPVTITPPDVRWYSAGKKLQPLPQAVFTSLEPELPLKPPRMA